MDNIKEFDDDALIEELQTRGYDVYYKGTPVDDAAWCLQNGNVTECLIQIERAFPELKGLSEKVRGIKS